MARLAALLGIALCVSVALNVRTYIARGSDSLGDSVNLTHSNIATLTPRKSAVTHGNGTTVLGSMRESAIDECSRELGDVRAQLMSAKEDLSQRIVPEERFESGSREMAMEAHLDPLVRAVVSKVPGLQLHDVECRTDICKINLGGRTRKDTLQGWKSIYSDPTIHGLADGFSTSAGEPVVDLATGRGGFDVETYIFTRSASDITRDLERLVSDFRANGHVNACGGIGPDAGTLEVRIKVDPEARRLLLLTGGDLATSALGKCIVDALRSAVERYQIPPTAKYGDVYASFVSPHGA